MHASAPWRCLCICLCDGARVCVRSFLNVNSNTRQFKYLFFAAFFNGSGREPRREWINIPICILNLPSCMCANCAYRDKHVSRSPCLCLSGFCSCLSMLFILCLVSFVSRWIVARNYYHFCCILFDARISISVSTHNKTQTHVFERERERTQPIPLLIPCERGYTSGGAGAIFNYTSTSRAVSYQCSHCSWMQNSAFPHLPSSWDSPSLSLPLFHHLLRY